MAPTHESVATVVLHGLGGRMFIALWGGMALVLVCRAVGLTAWLTTAAVVVLVGACSLGQRTLAALIVALTGWLVIDGFVAHRYGALGLDTRMVATLVAALATALTTSSITRKAAR
jgi:hypothetical protein